MIPIYKHIEKPEAIEYFNQNGYVAIESSLDKVLLEKIKQTMLHLIDVERDYINKKDYTDYGFLLCAPYYADKHPEILEIFENHDMLDFIEAILNKWFTIYLYTNNCIPPQKRPSKAAQVHVDVPRIIPNYNYLLATIILLDDFTNENGGTWILPNSQNMLEQPDNDYFFKHAIQVNAPAGSILYFNPRIWHAAGENKSPDWRSCLIVAYCKPWVKQRVDIPRFMEHIDKSKIDKNKLQLLGFHSQTPSNFGEFYGTTCDRTYTQPFV